MSVCRMLNVFFHIVVVGDDGGPNRNDRLMILLISANAFLQLHSSIWFYQCHYHHILGHWHSIFFFFFFVKRIFPLVPTFHFSSMICYSYAKICIKKIYFFLYVYHKMTYETQKIVFIITGMGLNKPAIQSFPCFGTFFSLSLFPFLPFYHIHMPCSYNLQRQQQQQQFGIDDVFMATNENIRAFITFTH